MNLDALAKRLARIEARRGTDRITGLCNLAAHPPKVAAEAVRDWRAWVADGRAGRVGDVLILRARRLTAAEWSVRYTPRPGRVH